MLVLQIVIYYILVIPGYVSATNSYPLYTCYTKSCLVTFVRQLIC